MSTFQDGQHPRGDDGQFATRMRGEPQVTLTAGGPVLALGPKVDDDDDDPEDRERTWSAAGTGNASFDAAVRALLGVTDSRRKVTATMNGGEYGSTYTPESWQDITVTCAERSASFEDLPSLLRALEQAQAAPVTIERLEAMIGQDALVRFTGGVTWSARVGNAKPYLVLLIGGERVFVPGGHGDWYRNPHGEWELRVAPGGLLSIDVPEPLPAADLARREHDRLVAEIPSIGPRFDDLPEQKRRDLEGLYTERIARLAQVLG
jgi:hypothetical protein